MHKALKIIMEKIKGINKGIITVMLFLANCCYGGGHSKAEEDFNQPLLPSELRTNIIYKLMPQGDEKIDKEKIKKAICLRECCKEFKAIVESIPGLFKPILYIDKKYGLEKVREEVKNYNYHYIIIIKDVLLTPKEEALYKEIFPNAEYQIQLTHGQNFSVSKISNYTPDLNFALINIRMSMNRILFPVLPWHLNNFLSHAIKEQHLRELYLPCNYITDENVKAIIKALPTCSSLRLLDLQQNNINAAGAKAISEALINNSSLTCLNLGFNNISDEGAKDISVALKKNKLLKFLNLDKNKICSAGAKNISNALKKNQSLTSLSLRFNKIGIEGAQDISEALKTNKSLNSLLLDNTSIRTEGALAISSILEINSCLTLLNLSYNFICLKGVIKIANGLAKNRSLTYLNLSSSNCGTEGAKAIYSALLQNSNLTSLDLRGNGISPQIAKTISERLAQRTPKIEIMM